MIPDHGLASLNSKALSEKFQHLGSALTQAQQDQLLTQLQVFQAALLSFKSEHSTEIVQNEQLRKVFADICVSFGIDPLVVASSISGEQNNKVERSNQLCLKMIELCNLTRPVNGGLILLKDLAQLINSDTWVSTDLHLKFTEEDVLDSLKHLNVMGDELQLVNIGNRKYIKSIPQDLDVDQSAILETADILGYVNVSILRDNFGWKKSRCQHAIDDLISNGILWVDIQKNHQPKYWITSWINK